MGFRLAWYATISTIFAGGVVISAFHQRPNFYSACVYVAQSNLCLMILTNLILLVYGFFVYSLQRVCFGPLRPIEIEQLYEKGWFAVTETCLAMTIFREEVGAWFLVMFVALLTGKVWGWIGDGRVEILGQQPPANPRLFHIRLSTSLAMSVFYDLALMHYIIKIVIQQARPDMMVMFLFEFAILTTSSMSTYCRYGISLIEVQVVSKQTQERISERRRELREERAEILRRREIAASSNSESSSESNVPLPSEDDVDEMDIEVPGWETKGQWVLTLDLVTDFIKFSIYTSFFIVLLMFYGIPIHIVRDLLLTARSCMKRLAAFLRYRRATRDMNERYPDATTDDIQREDTCIICRENMIPWAPRNLQPPAIVPGDAMPPNRPAASVNERTRPKKLPCGHILHLGCLKSWLERQQVCPTCRRPVVDSQGQASRNAANTGQGQGQPDGAAGQQPAIGRAPARGGMRMLNFGPLRLGFGQANLQDLARELGGQQAAPDNAPAGGPRVYGLELGFPRRAHAQQQPSGTRSNSPSDLNFQEQLKLMETQILGELSTLQLTQQEWQVINLLRAELERIRALRNRPQDSVAGNIRPQTSQHGQSQSRMMASAIPCVQTFQPSPSTIIPSGHADLPQGVTIPEGWSLLPLQNIDSISGVAAQNNDVPSTSLIPTSEENLDTNPKLSSVQNLSNYSEPSNLAIISNLNSSPSISLEKSNATVPESSSTLSSLKKSSPSKEDEMNISIPRDFSETSNSSFKLNSSIDPSSNSRPLPVDLKAPFNMNKDIIQDDSKKNFDIKGKAKVTTVEDTVDESEQ